MQREIISVVVPCCNEQAAIPVFYRELTLAVKPIANVDLEVIFVDDGSSDGSLLAMKKLADNFSGVKYISFSRNFGKEAAMYAGMKAANGDYVCVMDVDLQDPPELIVKMYDAIKNRGFDVAAARRASRRGEPLVRSMFAKVFYKMINGMSKTEFVDGARDFRLMTRQVADAVLQVKEYHRFAKGIFSWVGFKTTWISYNNVERITGKTKWSFMKLFLYSLEAVFSFTTTPLVVSSVLGTAICAAALIWMVVIIVKTLIWGDPVAGYPSMMCVIFLLSGVQLLTIGIIGQYLSKTYMEVKDRPIYITKETNTEENSN